MSLMAQKPKWTAATRAAFIARLAECGEVRAALATVGLSPNSAYRLRATDPDFARAWDSALLQSRQVVVAELTTRALHGWQEEVWFRGELVGTRTRHDNRLLLALIARLDAAAGKADEERVRRAAPHFADVLAALRHDVPLDPWFEASLAEKQEAAIDKACRRQRFWHYAALMDEETIEEVVGPSEPCRDDEAEEEYEEFEDDDEQASDIGDEHQPSTAQPEADPQKTWLTPVESSQPQSTDDAAQGDLAPLDTAALSSPRGCHPVSTMDGATPENQPFSALSAVAEDQPPSPPPAERPGGPLSTIEREAMEGDMAALCLRRIEPIIRLNPFAVP